MRLPTKLALITRMQDKHMSAVRWSSKLVSSFLKFTTHDTVPYSDWVCTAVMSNDVMKDLRG